MLERISATAFAAEPGLDDWRFLLGRIEARFDASSFGEAAAFVGEVASAADQANHHPDVDLRYPGSVAISLVTHKTGGLTSLDVSLARTISVLAAESGLRSDPTRSVRLEVAIDALDIAAILPFWAAIWGAELPTATEDLAFAELAGADTLGPTLWFQQMDKPRPQRNRIHFDLTVTHDVAEQRVQAALDAGGTLLSDARAKAFWVLADIEGNEVCICTWQDRS